jgi:hypothetical protein
MRPYQHLLIHALSFVAHCSHISHYDVRHIMSIYVLPRPPDAMEFKRELSCKECSVSPRAALNGSAWIKVWDRQGPQGSHKYGSCLDCKRSSKSKRSSMIFQIWAILQYSEKQMLNSTDACSKLGI